MHSSPQEVHSHSAPHSHANPEKTPGNKLVQVLYVDPSAGIAGDMFLGALVDLGVDFDGLKNSLLKLGVPGFDLVCQPEKRQTIGCTKVDVVVEDTPHPHRHLGDLLEIIEAAPLSEGVKRTSSAILTRLAEAEAAIHRMPLEKVHLHEVGGLDCLVDVVGTCLGLEELQVDRILSGPVSVGTGHVKCAHGKMPLPAPGTLAILQDFPIRRTLYEGEMTTPTGAAILTCVATPVRSPVTLIPRRTGYGAGTRSETEVANLLRLVLGEVEEKGLP